MSITIIGNHFLRAYESGTLCNARLSYCSFEDINQYLQAFERCEFQKCSFKSYGIEHVYADCVFNNCKFALADEESKKRIFIACTFKDCEISVDQKNFIFVDCEWSIK